MLCFYYKWMISQALDAGKDMPGVVNRHLGRCSSCQRFSRISQSLSRKLSQDSPQMLMDQKQSLKEKIKLALAQEKKPELVHRHMPRSLPLLAASMIVLVVAIGLVFHFNQPKVNNPPVNLSKISITSLSLQDILAQVESPMEKEMENIKQSMKSTAEFLASRLDFHLGKTLKRI